MYKILLLGANGLLGSRIQEVLKIDPSLNIISTSRNRSSESYFDYNFKSLRILVKKTKPDVIINCIVVTDNSKSWFNFLKNNSILPLQLALLHFASSVKVIHFSTDAVFRKTNRKCTEKSLPLPSTKYGITKLFGDFSFFGNIVIRSSFVGLSTSTNNKTNLVSRLNNSEIGSRITIEKNILWNGITLDILAELTKVIVKDIDARKGVFHIFSSTPISKIRLIEMLAKKLDREDLIIDDSDSQQCQGVLLATTKYQQILAWWNALGYSLIPSFEILLTKIKF